MSLWESYLKEQSNLDFIIRIEKTIENILQEICIKFIIQLWYKIESLTSHIYISEIIFLSKNKVAECDLYYLFITIV